MTGPLYLPLSDYRVECVGMKRTRWGWRVRITLRAKKRGVFPREQIVGNSGLTTDEAAGLLAALNYGPCAEHVGALNWLRRIK